MGQLGSGVRQSGSNSLSLSWLLSCSDSVLLFLYNGNLSTKELGHCEAWDDPSEVLTQIVGSQERKVVLPFSEIVDSTKPQLIAEAAVWGESSVFYYDREMLPYPPL